MGPGIQNKSIVHDAIIKDIADVVRRLAFGAVTIKVHQSKIVQIEITESKRFDEVWIVENGGGPLGEGGKNRTNENALISRLQLVF